MSRKPSELKTYNVHVGNSDRQFVRLAVVQAAHSLAAPKLAELQKGEHVLRVARPATDERMARKLKCSIEEIYEKSPNRQIARGLAEGGSIVDSFDTIKNMTQ